VDEIKKKYPSYEEFLSAINKEGFTITDIRKKIENQIKGQAMVDTEVRSKVSVNPQEVTEYFTAHSSDYSRKARIYLATIFVKSGFGVEAAKKKIDSALEVIKGGMDFKTAAAQYSELPSVGDIPVDQLRPEFRERIDKMNVGDVSDVFEVPNGFYIIKLEGRITASSVTLKDAKDRVYQELFEKKFRERYKKWIDGLRKKAYVEIKE